MYKIIAAILVTISLFALPNNSNSFGNPPISSGDVVKTSFKLEKTGDKVFIVGTFSMVDHYHIFPIYKSDAVTGTATELSLAPSKAFKVLGKWKEPKPFTSFDELLDEPIEYHDGTVKFKQEIQVLTDKPFKIEGTYKIQACKESCFAPSDYSFSANASSAFLSTLTSAEPITDSIEPVSKENAPVNSIKGAKESTTQPVEKASKPKVKNALSKKSLWSLFGLGLIAGLGAIFTPCVFPMLPMTVSFFTKRSKDKKSGRKNALLYTLSIIGIYVALGVFVTAIFGPNAMYEMSIHWLFNLVMFVMLVVFAISFLGAFEIRLPSAFVNKIDAQADRGGYLGIFFMALSLAVISFSCTGAFVAGILSLASTQGGIAPIIGMLGFSTALALPFGFFSFFPAYLNDLPKSGGWLNTVKVVLGFIELAFAFKFLSNADLIWDAHILNREVFLSIWIAICFGLSMYLFGFFQLPHDDKVEKISVGRGLLAITSLMMAIYMIPGLWGAPLKLISGLPPSTTYSESNSWGMSGGASSEVLEPEQEIGPLKLPVFKALEPAKAYALKTGKPLLIDFTGLTCANCRRMEETVWSEPAIYKLMRENIVIASLHVDESTPLPKSEQIKVELAPNQFKTLRTTGDKWLALSIMEYGLAAQPLYVMLDKNGKALSNGLASWESHSDPNKFQSWLEKGIKEAK